MCAIARTRGQRWGRETTGRQGMLRAGLSSGRRRQLRRQGRASASPHAAAPAPRRGSRSSATELHHHAMPPRPETLSCRNHYNAVSDFHQPRRQTTSGRRNSTATSSARLKVDRGQFRASLLRWVRGQQANTTPLSGRYHRATSGFPRRGASGSSRARTSQNRRPPSPQRPCPHAFRGEDARAGTARWKACVGITIRTRQRQPDSTPPEGSTDWNSSWLIVSAPGSRGGRARHRHTAGPRGRNCVTELGGVRRCAGARCAQRLQRKHCR